MARPTRQVRRAAERAAHGRPPPRRPPFNWRDAITLLAIPFAVMAMFSENNIIIGLCFAVSWAIVCAPIVWHPEILREYRFAYSVLIGLLCGGLFTLIKNENLAKELARNEGILEPGSDYSGRPSCPAASDKWVGLYIGPHTFYLDKFPQPIIRIAQREILTLDRKGENLVIRTLNLFDDQGNVFASINNGVAPNNFWVKPDVRRYRPDKHTLVVFDRHNDEALRIIYLNPHAISITGTFRYLGRPPVIYTPTFFQAGGISGSG